MGEQKVSGDFHGEQLRAFMRQVLRDLRALELMLGKGLLESGARRIGAEQEMFLVDSLLRPAPASLSVLEMIEDTHFTTEIAAFNLEVNLDPLPFTGRCLSELHASLDRHLDRVRVAGRQLGVEPLLVGILPTIHKEEAGIESLTEKPRYHALNEALGELRGTPYEFRIKGTDELIIKHDSVMIEGCNTSFQVHLQIEPSEFACFYNTAQAIAAPVLSAATNSPLLFGKRLWRETRIALFQQAVDTRSSVDYMREASPRVTFGTRWLDGSVLDLYREDIARFRVLLGAEDPEDPFEVLERGEIPELKALRVFNSTVYRWNRACYGVTEGKAHLRIENRVLPAGPTPADEVANAALWLGLMEAAPQVYGDVRKLMSFDDAKTNFLVAARVGLQGQFNWFGGESVPAQDLICERLLPLARQGLEHAGLDGTDIDTYLGIIDERVRSGMTGSQWMIQSLEAMKGDGKRPERLNAVTAGILRRQKSGNPVATWDLARIDEAGGIKRNYWKVEHYMTTDLFTVCEDEPIELVASIMDWQKIRHVPVEDNQNRLVGVVSYRTLLRLLARGWSPDDPRSLSVGEVMKREPIFVAPDTPTTDAVELMRKNRISALPVVKDGRLVGIISERDFMQITSDLLAEKLREERSDDEDTPESKAASG